MITPYTRRSIHRQHPVVCAVLFASVAACSITAASVYADPYLPLYSNADSEDILSLQSDVPFRFLPDIDGDGRPETLTVENGSLCRTSVIHHSSFLSNGALTTADSAGQWRLFDSGGGCTIYAHTEVIGDVNGDGRRDLSVTHHDYDLSFNQAAVVFTSATAGDIDIANLNGSDGFVLENRNNPVRDAGDVNGDGFDDIIVDSHRVVAGGTGFAASYASYVVPVGIIVDSALSGGGFERIGDLNGDGYEDLLYGHINALNAYAVIYGGADLSRTLDEFADLDIDGGQFMQQCAYSFGCGILPVGDVDGDGFDDLTVSRFGCGYAQEAAILYGAAGGVPLRDSLGAYLSGEITRVVDNVSGGCLSGVLSGSPGDLDGDGLRDMLVTGLEGTASAAILFGTNGNRPAVVSVDALDGTEGVLVDFPDAFEYGYTTRENAGMDINGDGRDDLVDYDGFWMYESDSEVLSTGRESQLALPGKPRELDINGPVSLVAEQVDEGWHVRWQPTVNGLVDGYRALVDGEPVTTLAASTTQFLLTQDNASPPFRIDIEALGANDALIGTSIRQVVARYEDDLLSATVYGSTLVELIFDRQVPWDARTMTYQVWRNCEFLTLAQENSSGYWDSTARPGQSYTYFLTPLYSRFNEVATPAALRDYPSLQRRSNSVTVVTPGGDGNVEPIPLPCLNGASGDVDDDDNGDGSGDSGDSDSNEERVMVDGLVISWQADGWHQVQSLDDYQSWCEGGYDCTVEPGTYVVINHTSGERIEPVIVTGDDTDSSPGDTTGPVVDGNTISWPDDGWYQVQDAVTYVSLCEGGLFCEVPAGTYIVINHHTGQRWVGVEVTAQQSLDGVVVDGNTITVSDDGWYQVQDADTYASLCEGVLSCVVPDGRYIVINHTTGVRFSNVVVGTDGDGTSDDEPVPSSDSDALAPSNVRVTIYGSTIAELFWDNASGVVSTEIYRDGEVLGTSQGSSYFDGTRQAEYPHRYALVAIDGDGQRSSTVEYGDFEDATVEVSGYFGGSNGYGLALSGNTAAMTVDTGVGERTFHVFERSDAGQSDWTATASLTNDKEFIWDSAVALDADTLLFATMRSDDASSDYENELHYVEHDYRFAIRENSGVWRTQPVVEFSDARLPNTNSSVSVAIDGDTAMLGGRNAAVYVFYRDSDGQWLELQKLTASSGSPIGHSLSLDGDTVVIGATVSYYDNGSANLPSAYVFARDDNGYWSEQQILQPSPDRADYYNSDAVLDGDTLVMKGFSEYDFDNRTSTSWHFVYTQIAEGQWVQTQQITVDSHSTSIALDGDTLLIGAPGSNGSAYQSGAVFLYGRSTSGEWLETRTLLAGVEVQSFGSSTALDGHTAIANGSYEDTTRGLFYSLPDQMTGP